VWAPQEYDKLPAYDASTAEQPVGAFLCHQQDGRLCAGWAGCHDMGGNLALRFAVIRGEISEEDFEATLDYESPVPLFESGAAAAEHGMADIEAPDERAVKTMAKLTRKISKKP
jgi:hypothetical protein